jgi:lipid-A-disaccharide synthase
MEAAGQRRVVRAEDVAHMGITEVLRHAPYIFGQYRKLVRALKRDKPDIAVLIDFPDVNFRLAKHCKRLGIPVLWFVSPQLWAWKRKRLRWVQQRVNKMLVIFPFEQEFYRNRGVDAAFVGHPLATLPMHNFSREVYAAQYGLRLKTEYAKPKKKMPWIALLPGSRWKEVQANLPTMIRAADIIGGNHEFLLPVASTLDWRQLQEFVSGLKKGGHGATPPIHLVPDAREALWYSRASIVASGTATVQALTIGNPFVVVYRVSRLTFALAKRLVRYPSEIAPPGTLEDEYGNLPIAMPNLIAGRRIVPELLNERFTAENLASALRPLLEDTPERAQMLADLAETRGKLLPLAIDGKPANPIAAVCDAIESLIGLTPSGKDKN